MLLNGSAVNVVAVNAIDQLVVLLQGLSQYSTSTSSEIRLLANLIAGSSYNYSSDSIVSTAAKVYSGSKYSVTSVGDNITSSRVAGSSSYAVESTARSKVEAALAGNAAWAVSSLGALATAITLGSSGSRYGVSSAGGVPSTVANLAGDSYVGMVSEADARLTMVAGSSEARWSVAGDSDAVFVGLLFDGKEVSYGVRSAGGVPVTVAGLGSDATYGVQTEGSSVLSTAVSGDSRYVYAGEAADAPLIGLFYSSSSGYSVRTVADSRLNILVESAAKLGVMSGGKATVLVPMAGDAGYSIGSDSDVLVVTSLGASEARFALVSSGKVAALATVSGLSEFAYSSSGRMQLAVTVSGGSEYSVETDGNMVLTALVDAVVEYAVGSDARAYLSSSYKGDAGYSADAESTVYALKFSVETSEDAYVVEPVTLVYNVEKIDNVFNVAVQ